MLSQFMRWNAAGGLLLILIGSLMPTAALAESPAPHNVLIFRVTEKNSQLSMTEKESRLVELDGRIKTVDGFDPAILKVTTVDNFHQVRILALAPGFTSLVVVDEFGHSHTIEVLVSGDVKQLDAIIRRAAPGSSIQALKVKDNVLLLGWVDQPSEATKIVELAEQFHPKVLNYLQVSGVQTIMLRVKMMEVQRSKIRSLGFNFLQTRVHSYVGSTPGPLTPFATGIPQTNLGNPFGNFTGPLTTAVNPAGATAIFGMAAADNAFQGFIEALKTNNLLKILAEPTLTTTNGRPASFLAGGQFPVPVPQGLGTVSVVYKSFGVQLEFVPTIMGSGRLRMQIKPEVSEKDLQNSIIVQGINVPALSTRAVNTEVEMNFGETVVIAGLISNRVQATSQSVPFFGELPWVGAAFRRVRYDESESELLVMVTPELAAPSEELQLGEGPGQQTVTPTDRELFFNGYLETPRYGPDPVMDPTGTPPNYIPAPPGHSDPIGPMPSTVSPPPAPRNGTALPEELPPSEPSANGAGAQSSATSKRSGAIRQVGGTKRNGKSSPSERSAGGKPQSGSKPRPNASPSRNETRPGLIAP
jgi:pilus assembly protein CpaC